VPLGYYGHLGTSGASSLATAYGNDQANKPTAATILKFFNGLHLVCWFTTAGASVSVLFISFFFFFFFFFAFRFYVVVV
jgi:hypothetical protein